LQYLIQTFADKFLLRSSTGGHWAVLELTKFLPHFYKLLRKPKPTNIDSKFESSHE